MKGNVVVGVGSVNDRVKNLHDVVEEVKNRNDARARPSPVNQAARNYERQESSQCNDDVVGEIDENRNAEPAQRSRSSEANVEANEPMLTDSEDEIRCSHGGSTEKIVSSTVRGGRGEPSAEESARQVGNNGSESFGGHSQLDAPSESTFGMFRGRGTLGESNECHGRKSEDRNNVTPVYESIGRGRGVKRRKEENEDARLKKALRSSMTKLSDAVEESNDVMKKIGAEVSKSVQNEMMLSAMGFLDKDSEMFKTLLNRLCENAITNVPGHGPLITVDNPTAGTCSGGIGSSRRSSDEQSDCRNVRRNRQNRTVISEEEEEEEEEEEVVGGNLERDVYSGVNLD